MEKDTQKGHYHPLSIVIRDCARIFGQMGFSVADGPEIETEHYNFDALNIPANHPARDLWDTFWLKQPGSFQFPISNFQTNFKSQSQKKERQKLLLRTHTSPVQIREMEKQGAPIRIVVPGKTYRYEATDATHEAQFYQLEGLMVDEHTSLATMRFVLEKFFSEFFGKKIEARLRPSYFPFVEPGVEVDMSCFVCKAGTDFSGTNADMRGNCSVCKGGGWVEIMGAGMVHPRVLLNVGIDPRKYQGFAFGGGIERLAMLKYGVDDVRLFHQGDLRLVNQF